MRNIKTISAIAFVVGALSGCQSSLVDSTNMVKTNTQATTFARYVPERKDDFAWENDLVAFRMYGPAARSGAENAGLDCWLKRVKTPIVNKWYKQMLEQDKSYHKDWGEGLDNYHVGDSAGCGSSALWLDGKREPLETWVEWEILEQSPEKTSFVLKYEHTIKGDVYKENKQIEIKTGERVFKVTSTFWKNGEIAKNLPLSIGIATHDGKADAAANKSLGMVSAWEVLEGSGLGTGVLVDPKYVTDYQLVESNGVRDAGHALLITSTDENGQAVYYAGYGWEKAQEITTIEQWNDYLKHYAKTKATF